MNKLGIDVSHFKKIGYDSKSTLLRHNDGHEIRIHHKSISPDIMESIKKMPIHKMADGGLLDADEISDISKPSMPEENVPSEEPVNDSPNASNYGTPSPESSEPIVPQEESVSTEKSSMEIPEENIQQQQQSTSPSIPGPVGTNALAALEEQKKGQQMVAQAQGELGKDTQAIVSQAAQENKIAHGQMIRDQAKLQEDKNNITNWLAANPENSHRYVDKMSTSGRIQTAIGLLLGGIGAGLTHGPNLAYKYLEDQINRDIDDQKSQIATKKGLLAHNLQETGNLKQAYQLTRMQNNDIMADYLRAAAGKAQSAAAKGAMLDLSGKFNLASEQIKQQLATRSALIGTGSVSEMDPAKKLLLMKNAGIIDDKQYEHGNAELAEYEKHEAINENALDSFRKVAKMNTTSYRAQNPIQSQSQIDAEWDPMVEKLIKDSAGRVTPISAELVSKLRPKLTDTQPTLALKEQKLQALLAGSTKVPTILRGLNVVNPKKTQAASKYQEGQTARNAQGKVITFRNGKWQ